MLYSEFVEGTGCRDNDYNYKVYRALEQIYMCDEFTGTKQDIYEMGAKLVDNSKSESEKAVEAEMRSQIEELELQIERRKRVLEYEVQSLEYWKEQGDKEEIKRHRRAVRYWKGEINRYKADIAKCKWVLGE